MFYSIPISIAGKWVIPEKALKVAFLLVLASIDFEVQPQSRRQIRPWVNQHICIVGMNDKIIAFPFQRTVTAPDK